MSLAGEIIKVGDVVEYSTSWLRSTGQYTGDPAPTSWGPFAKGQVFRVDGDARAMGPAVVLVKWEDGRESASLMCNLSVVRRRKS